MTPYKRTNAIIISIIILCIFSLGAGSRKAKRTYTEPRKDWYLVWHDEFDEASLDKFKWQVEDAALVKNNELQYYTPEDVYLENGKLILRSQKRLMGAREYTSGLVETKGKFSQQYGRIEVRAKLPRGKGIWPAHWMLPDSGKWPPEIDIIEVLGHQPNVMYMNIYWGVWPNQRRQGEMFIGPDFSNDFHVFAIEWDENAITWFVDEQQRFQVTEHIPREPFYIILNTAVGGDWPGRPNSRTEFPQYHEIDYVRVYAQDIPGTYILNTKAINGTIEEKPKQARYKKRTRVTLYARPRIGFLFSHWEGDLQGNKNPVRIIMNKHKKIEAKFVTNPNAPKIISSNKKIRASSSESNSLLAQNAVDGNYKTRWSSNFSDPQSITIDLEAQYKIKDIRLCWEVAYARQYKIKISEDANKWKTIYTNNNGKGDVEEITGLNVQGRYVMLQGEKRAREFGYSLWEIEIYGDEIE